MKSNTIYKYSLHHMVMLLEKSIKMSRYKCEVQYTLHTDSEKKIQDLN